MAYKNPGKNSEYIRSILPRTSSAHLRRIEDYADEHYVPVLLPETSVVLSQLVTLSQPKTILEIGMAIGYSGHIMLEASKDAHLYTIEIDEDNIAVAKRFFKISGLDKRVTIYEGNSDEIVPSITGKYDFIFLDGPKAQYIEYLPFLLRALNPGGLLVCDNVLFNGMVTGEQPIAHKKGGIVRKLDAFLRALMADTSLSTSILPVGDGLSFSIVNK